MKEEIILEALLEKLARDKPHISTAMQGLVDCSKKELQGIKLMIDELIKKKFGED